MKYVTKWSKRTSLVQGAVLLISFVFFFLKSSVSKIHPDYCRIFISVGASELSFYSGKHLLHVKKILSLKKENAYLFSFILISHLLPRNI